MMPASAAPARRRGTPRCPRPARVTATPCGAAGLQRERRARCATARLAAERAFSRTRPTGRWLAASRTPAATVIARGTFSSVCRCSSAARSLQRYARASRLAQTDGYSLLRRSSSVLTFADMPLISPRARLLWLSAQSIFRAFSILSAADSALSCPPSPCNWTHSPSRASLHYTNKFNRIGLDGRAVADRASAS